MQAGRCYTVVGASAPPIENLDLELAVVSPLSTLPGPTLAQDQTSSPTAIVAGKPNCFKALISGPMRLMMTVSSGQGIAAAQVYEK